ncbi:MAG TPA: TonB-dependent receptor [Bacteroidia bacterium]|nr:TonB-dependent receptor [Bacteroidia bacterium]
MKLSLVGRAVPTFLSLVIPALWPCALQAQDSESLPSTVVESAPAPRSAAPAPRSVPTAPPPAPAPLVIDDALPQPLTVRTLDEAVADLSALPGGVAVVDADDYRRGRATNLKDALDYAPGVFIQPRFGAEESRLSIRGSGIQRTFHGRGLKLMQDGVPLNLADGGFDFQSVEPLSAQYIEVYRGANALEYGSTTLGGAINFVSHTGRTAPGIRTRLEYGSFDSFRGQISGGIDSGDSDAYASLTHSSGDGFREHSKQSTQRLFANFGKQLSDTAETRFYLTYVKTDSELPGELTKAQMEADPTQASRVAPFLRGNPAVARFDMITSDWKRDFELFRIANRTVWETAEGRISLGAFWSHKDLDHPILYAIDQVADDFGVDLRYEHDADLWGRENHFVAGFAPTYGIVEDTRFANLFGQRGAKFSDSRQTSLNADFYVQNHHHILPHLAIVAGAQLSHAVRENEDRFPVGPDNSDRQEWTAFSPKIGVVWEVAPEAQIFANVSRSFEPPSFGELVDANFGGAGLVKLDEQTATTFEIGTRGRTGKAAWDVAWYYSLIDSELLQYQVAPGLNQTVNADDTRHQGIEAFLDLELASGIFARGGGHSAAPQGKAPIGKAPVAPWEDRLVFRQNYLWNDFKFDDDAIFGDNRLPGIPEHYYRAELLYEHPSGLYLGPNVEWVAEGYNVDSAATEFTDPYGLLGFKVGYRRDDRFSVFVEAKNLTDETYAATTSVINTYGGGGIYLPGDGRGVYFGLEVKW